MPRENIRHGEEARSAVSNHALPELQLGGIQRLVEIGEDILLVLEPDR